MERNRYAPPSTEALGVIPTEEITILREVIPRPVSVWLLVVSLSIFDFYLSSRAVLHARELASQGSASANSLGFAVTLIFYVAVVAGLALVVACIFQGKSWSRWVGVALMVAFIAAGLARPDNTFYANDAQRTGGFVGRMVVIPLLFFWWVYALGFSAKAKRFFSRRSTLGA